MEVDEDSIHNISSFPSIDEIAERREKIKVDLPVYCLSLFKSTTLKDNAPGVLCITDFTEYENTVFNTVILKYLPSVEFHFDDDLVLESSKVFSVNVPVNMMRETCEDLYKVREEMKAYDFQNPHKCNFEREGIFARAEFILKPYRGSIEGYLISLKLLRGQNFSEWYSKDEKLKKLIERFVVSCPTRVKENTSKHFPLNQFIPRSTSKRSKSGAYIRDFAPAVEQEKPRKRQSVVEGANLMFRQQPSTDDTQSPLASASQVKSRDLDLNMSSFDEFLIEKVSIAEALSIPATLKDVKKEYQFEVNGFVLGMLPQESFIIKPFKRTMKVANFKLIISDELRENYSINQTLCLEFNNDNEICRFFDIHEVEELLDKMDNVRRKLQNLISKRPLLIKFRIKRAYANMGNNILRPYWTSMSTLDSLL